MSTKDLVLVSACLVGLQTRYDGKVVNNPRCLQELEQCTWIPVCPEQLGGLPTPRCAADVIDGNGDDVLKAKARVICKDGVDVTDAFIRGAEQVLAIAQKQRVTRIFLKARSPSCGVINRGVTAALLIEHGFSVVEFD